jgi:diguanylate cyclase (GGDEF)-like protein/PAS domain S-box-containing protein
MGTGALYAAGLVTLGAVVAVAVFLLSRERQDLAALRDEKDRAKQYLDTVRTMLVGGDFQGRVFLANRMACDVLGLPQSEIVGRLWFDCFPEPSRRAELLQGFREFLAHPARYAVAEYKVLDARGNTHLVRWHRSLQRGPDGEVVGVLSAGEDVTERRRVEEQLRFDSFLLDSTHDSIIIHDADGHILYANAFASDIRGVTHDELMKRDYATLLTPDDLGRKVRQAEDPNGTEITTVEAGFIGTDGGMVPFEVRSKPIDYHGRHVTLSMGRDITERRKAEKAVRKLAFYDALTGLASRPLFDDRIDSALVSARRRSKRVSVMFLDLDGFKDINDTLGHAAGDEILCQVAHRIKTRVRRSDTACRFGGDEFTVLLTGRSGDAAAAEGIAADILAAFSQPFSVGGETVDVGASIGLATGGAETTGGSALLARADSALYDAKNAGRGRIRMWRPGDELRSGRRPAPRTSTVAP